MQAVVDIEEALEESDEALQVFRAVQSFAGGGMSGGMSGGMAAPAFSGGVWDSWPAWAVDALEICDCEMRAAHALARHEEQHQRK